jgi:hypothetical protein
MAIVTDRGSDGEVDRHPALLDVPQPLGFLPTRQFWRYPENNRLAGLPLGIVGGLLVIVIGLLGPPWWVGGLVAAAGIWLMLGLLERYIRHVAKRRFRSRPEPAKVVEASAPADNVAESGNTRAC